MSSHRSVAMDGVEIEDFLKAQNTGVLAMGKDDHGYGIPISFYFDDRDQDIYFRLGYLPDSQKREFVDASDYVSFVVYSETDEGWKSVVARGELDEISDSNMDSSILEATRKLDIPFVTIFERPAKDLQFRLTRLDVDNLTGRKVA